MLRAALTSRLPSGREVVGRWGEVALEFRVLHVCAARVRVQVRVLRLCAASACAPGPPRRARPRAALRDALEETRA